MLAPPPGQRLRGWVRSFRGTWGFVNCDSFPGDIFVGLKGNPHLDGLAQDDHVEFEIRTDDRGKSEAVNVTLCASAERRSFSEHAGAAAAQTTSRVRLQGWVRSFTGQWGFLNSQAFEGDVFVGLKSNPHLAGLSKDDRVEFEIATDDRGKNEAVNVVLLSAGDSGASAEARPLRAPRASGASPGSGVAPALSGLSGVSAVSAQAARAQVPHLLGERLKGRLKSFRDQWGFVNSDSFEGDLFLHARSNPELGSAGPGDPVQFEVAQDQNSTGFQAVNAVLLKDNIENLVGETLRGWVKSFKDTWGLINSQRFDGDVFVGIRTNPQLAPGGLQQGERVEFEVARDDAKNGYQALRVKRLGEAAPLPVQQLIQSQPLPLQPLPLQPLPLQLQPLLSRPPAAWAAPRQGRVRPEALVGQRVRGSVRSFRDGWGFVISDVFEGDLFLHLGSNPGLAGVEPGDPVDFDIAVSSSGKCHATQVQPLVLELQDLVGHQCSGTVRNFNDTWGFITSPKYIGDLFVGLRSNPHLPGPLRPGDSVQFTVQRSSGSKSQTGFEAVAVKALASSGAAVAAVQGFRHTSSGPSLSSPSRAGLATSFRGDDRSRSPHANGRPLRDAGARDPASLVGMLLFGQVRSFRGAWGFINSDSFDGDLFVGTKGNTHLPRELTAGDAVQFKVAVGAGGKAEAVEVQLLS